MKKKTMTAEFYALHALDQKDFSTLLDLLTENKNGHAPSISLENKSDGSESDEKYQIRSIASNKIGSVFKAVFGRCRFNEALEQASEESDDKEVSLLPGHGLVEKNHFLFFKENNLIVYQKNGNGSNIGKLQRYLNRVTRKNILLETILTEDSYNKLINSGPLKKIEVSILPPPFAEIEEEGWLRDLIKSFTEDNAKRIKLTLTANAGYPLPESYKESLANLARAGWAKVARATVMPDRTNVDIDDSNLKNEIIDLILNKITREFQVDLHEKNKYLPQDVFSGLAKAKDECNEKIKFFFTRT